MANTPEEPNDRKGKASIILIILALCCTLIIQMIENAQSWKNSVDVLNVRIQHVDPWFLRSSVGYRLECASSGKCPGCPFWTQRLVKPDCSEPMPDSEFKTGVENESWIDARLDQHRDNPFVMIILWFLSIPATLLYLILVMLRGGVLAALIALASLGMGFQTADKFSKDHNLFVIINLGLVFAGIYRSLSGTTDSRRSLVPGAEAICALEHAASRR